MTMMSVYHVANLPVVQGDELLGMVSEEEVMSNDTSKEISSFTLSHSYVYVTENDHIFDVISKLVQCNLSVIPVLNAEEKYVGMITQEVLLKYYANTFSFTEPGSIIAIKINKREYSLSEMTRVIEMEGGVVLSSFITSHPSTDDILVTLKIKQNEMGQIMSALERYDYDIHASFSEDKYVSDLKNRYDMLMTYLNV